MKDFLVARENIRTLWPLVKGLVEKALEETDDDVELPEVLDELMSGHAQLWVGYDEDLKLRMIATTKIEVWPRFRRFRIDLLAGVGLEEFYPLLPRLEAWAKEQGCTETIASVRPGLTKGLVKKLGFTLGRQTVFRGIL